MRSSTVFSAGGLLLAAGLTNAQTFTDCNPLEKTCPCDPGLGGSLTTDFTQGKSSDWTYATGTTLTYSSTDGAQFSIKTTEAPTIESNKYIMFGKVSIIMKAAPGTGVVSSFILESADLDEIDWEWIGSVDNDVQSNFFGKGNTTTYDRGAHHTMTDPVGSYHEYAIDWTKDYVKWEIDGVVVRTLLYTDALALGGQNFPQTPMQVKMGNWVGCADAAAAADPTLKWTCQWAGGPMDLSKAPFVMSVKSVTIQDYGTGGDYCYSDKSGSYQSITSNGKSSGSSSSSDSSSSVSAPTGSSSTASAKGSASTKAGSSTVASGSSSSGSSSGTTSTVSSDTSATTLTSTVSAATGTAIVAAAATTASSTAKTTSSSGAQSLKPKHQYGVLDFSVMALGLALGYLVM
jgi:beta-glucanase (GH16 family)